MDLEKAQKEFIKYTENYDLRDSNIIRKLSLSNNVWNNWFWVRKYFCPLSWIFF